MLLDISAKAEEEIKQSACSSRGISAMCMLEISPSFPLGLATIFMVPQIMILGSSIALAGVLLLFLTVFALWF